MQSLCLRCSRGRGHVAVVVVVGSHFREQVAAVFIVSVGGKMGVLSGDDVGEAVVAEFAFLIVQVEASVFARIYSSSGTYDSVFRKVVADISSLL